MQHSSYLYSQKVFWISAAAVLVLGCLSIEAVAGGRESLRGPHPWDFPERNRETAFAYQYARDNRAANNGTGAAAIAGALGGTVIINNSTTAVGNWQQIEMTLGDGAEGLVMTENHQDNSGAATASTSILDNAFEAADWTGGDHAHTRGGHDDRRPAISSDGETNGTAFFESDQEASHQQSARDHTTATCSASCDAFGRNSSPDIGG